MNPSVLPVVIIGAGPVGLAAAAHALSRNLRPLEQRKLLAVSPEGRHRTRLVHLTPTGAAALGQIAASWERAQTALEHSLGAPGIASVRNATAALTESASRTGG